MHCHNRGYGGARAKYMIVYVAAEEHQCQCKVERRQINAASLTLQSSGMRKLSANECIIPVDVLVCKKEIECKLMLFSVCCTGASPVQGSWMQMNALLEACSTRRIECKLMLYFMYRNEYCTGGGHKKNQVQLNAKWVLQDKSNANECKMNWM